jgi:phage gpG-like protein
MATSITVKPTMKEVKAEFKARRENFENIRPAHVKVSIFLDQWVQRNFKNQGSELENGDVWPDFALGGRVKKGVGLDRSAKLLQDTGRLKFSFLPFASKTDAGIGSKIKYSKYHNKGIGVPKRRILPLQVEVRERIRKILTTHGRKSMKIHGDAT